jgi:hypothetical protein
MQSGRGGLLTHHVLQAVPVLTGIIRPDAGQGDIEGRAETLGRGLDHAALPLKDIEQATAFTKRHMDFITLS